MKWRLFAIVWFISWALGSLIGLNVSPAQFNGCPAGFCSPSRVGGGATYTGPGDIASGALAWWGLRAYNGAYAAAHGNVVQLCNSSGASCVVVTANTNGSITAPGATACGGSACTNIATLYDQSGNSHDMVQGTAAAQPTFSATGLNGLPIAQFTSAQSLGTTGTAIANQNAPITFSWLFKDTGTSNAKAITLDDTFGTGIQSNAASNIETSQIEFGSLVSATGLDLTHYHSLQALWAIGTNAHKLDVDGTTAMATSTATNPILHNYFLNPSFDAPGTFNMTESGLWASDTSSTWATMISNQTGYWGPL